MCLERRPQGGGYKQARRLPYNDSSGNLSVNKPEHPTYDQTSCHPRIACTCSCIGCVTAGSGSSKGSAAIPIATIATVRVRRSSSCDDGSDYVQRVSRTERIHQRLLGEIPRQEVSYAVQPEESCVGFRQTSR